jgi:glucose/arabinose dehydrogenase/plastocyanin
MKQIKQYIKRKSWNKYSWQKFLRYERRAQIRLTNLIVILVFVPIIIVFLAGQSKLHSKNLTIDLSLIASGFNSPVQMAIPNDGTWRTFIIDQVGLIRVMDVNGTLLDEPFLDVTDRMVSLSSSFDERGLLSMAFHPDFVNNGRFFVFYNVPLKAEDPPDFDSRVRISEFIVSSENPNKADPESEVILLEIIKPQFNHNGGQLAFGPDGFLYISIGDGGNANDVGPGHTPELGNGQDTSTLLGKLLRYDAETPGELNVPPSNPFIADTSILDPIYAYGLRNPWRFSFDMGGEQRLFCADAGQDLYEEVDIILAGGNYGWNIKEGFHCFDLDNPTNPPAQCPEIGSDGKPLIDPIIEYSHLDESGKTVYTSVIGGYVNRSSKIQALEGRYIFGDFSSNFNTPDGTIFVAEEDKNGEWQIYEASIKFTGTDIDNQNNSRLNRFILGFGQDINGDVYVFTKTNLGPTGSTGQMFKIVSSAVEIDVENFRFDADDNDGTQVDTVIISVGDTVRWIWKGGVHTVTSGDGAADPEAGDLFDAPINGSNQNFSFTFTEAGTFPYFCRPHEGLNMKGVIVVCEESTLDSITGVLHIPSMAFENNNYEVELEYAGMYLGDIYFKLKSFIQNSISACEESTLDSITGILHIPSMAFENNNYEVELEYAGMYLGDIYFKIKSATPK